MLVIFLFVVLGILLFMGLYAGLMSAGLLPWHEREPGQGSRSSGYSTTALPFSGIPHMRELPQGCLIVLILACTLWFAAWGVLLVIVLNFMASAT